MTGTLNVLLEAVDDLTLTKRVKRKQDVLDGEPGDTVRKTVGTRTVESVMPPKLVQLDEAIRSSIGGSASGRTLAFTRSVLDPEALSKAMQIESQIKDWCRMISVHPDRSPAENLRAWYARTRTLDWDVRTEAFYVRTLRSWAAFIDAKMDPWNERELPDECPACGATEWWRDGERYFHPLVVRYKPVGAETIEKARAMCRACEQVWHIRELQVLLYPDAGNTEAAVVTTV